MKFKHYIKESDTVNMIELAYFLDTYTLNEGIKDDISKGLKTMLNKLGLKAHKEKGLIQILIDSGKNTGKLFYHLFKYHTNRDDKHRERIREISSKVTKQNVIDVLLKLDVISLHILTGPIHTLNALTG